QMQQKLQSTEQEMDNYARQLRQVETSAEQLAEQLRQAEEKSKQHNTTSPLAEPTANSEEEAATDTTKFDDLEIQLQAAMQEVERANQTKSQFLSSISHELRIALNAVLGFTQVLTLDDGLNEKQKNYLGEITQAGNHLLKVVSNVIDLVKLETGKSELHNESIDVFELVRHCIDQLADKAQEKNITLAPTAPDATGSVFAYADKERLMQVVTHTISNAIKYSNEGANIEIQCSTDNGDAKVGIKNTGADFAKAVQDPLLSNASEQAAQIGGLSSPRIELLITNTLLELMGGTVQYVFDPEKVVEILVPEANVQENEPVIPKIEERNATDDQSTQTQTNDPVILYIEDNPANIRLVETLLTQRPKYRLVATQNPENVTDLIKNHKPILILLDMNLPNCNGYDILVKVQQDSMAAGVPVVAVSADAVKSDVEQALQSGFSGYLSKPMEINKFLNAIDTLLSPSQTDNVQQLHAQ
ncbi:MAG: response regulator, partial [Gammaproteobacteria bacterium]